MTQTAFAQALLDGSAPLPEGLMDPRGRCAQRRFNVYRNNVAVSLRTALEDGFPVIRRIVGEEFFAAMAGLFLRVSPPSSPVLSTYGESFPEFLSTFQPVSHLAYLPDVARLELALRDSYHAADATPIAPDVLADLGLEHLLSRRIQLSPTLRILESHWPILSIWEANVHGKPLRSRLPESVMILRPAFDPQPVLLPRHGAAMVQAVLDGSELGQALSLGSEAEASEVLSLLLKGQAITEILK